MDKILIITGGSKGIGSGIVAAYLNQGYRVFSISRTLNTSAAFAAVQQITLDLSHTQQLEQALESIFSTLVPTAITQLTLLNNAGTLGQIGPLNTLSSADIEKTVQLNTIAPLVLTAKFLSLSQNWPISKQVINISSGAAAKPYHGWVVYCSTKAALDMMTQALALEQSSLPNGAKLLSIYPGVVDTDMQSQIRSSDKTAFAALDRFLELKSSGGLASTTDVGQAIFELAQDQSLPNGAIVRIEDPKPSTP